MVLTFDKTGKYGHRGKWLLLSKSKPRRVLFIFPGKPSKSEFLKQERRVQYWKNLKGKRTFGSFPKRRIWIRRRDRVKQRYWKNFGSGGIKLYHVTKKEYVPSILKKGLFPHKPKSVFGERSKDDPPAVYTFIDNPLLTTKSSLLKSFQQQTASETSHIKKNPRDPYSVPPEEEEKKAVLEINLPLEEFEKRRLPPSYGAREHEVPISGYIPSKNIRVLGKDFFKKALKEKSILEDYGTLSKMTPEEQIKYVESRGYSQFKKLFKEK